MWIKEQQEEWDDYQQRCKDLSDKMKELSCQWKEHPETKPESVKQIEIRYKEALKNITTDSR